MNSEQHNMDEHQDSFQGLSTEVSRDRVESLWRQAQNHRSSAQSDLTAARASRTRAEMERHRIANEALEATRHACGELIAEAERQLMRARQVEAEVQKMRAEADTEMKQAQMSRSEADSYRERVMAEVQQEAQRMRDEARSATLRECDELKRHVTYEVQCILSEIDTIRAAAQEELEAQRIYAEAATIKTMSHNVRAQVMGRMDKALNEKNGADARVLSQERPESWEVVGVENSHSYGPMAEPVESKADGQHHNGMPLDQMDKAAETKSSRAGKGSSGHNK